MAQIFTNRSEKFTDFFWGITIPLVLTLPFWFISIDLWFEGLFYNVADHGWPFAKQGLLEFLYSNGKWPLIVMIVLSIFALLYSIFKESYHKFRMPALFLLLAVTFGPGYVVNGTLKEYMGRPRPRDVVEFDGRDQYRYPLQPGMAGKGQSFPSGHATLGFAFFALSFALRPLNRKWAKRTFWLALSFGLLMGLGRNIQGGHFLSDVIWSGAVTWLSCAFLYHYYLFPKNGGLTVPMRWILLAVFVLVATVQILFFKVFFYEYEYRAVQNSREQIQLVIDKNMRLTTVYKKGEPYLHIATGGQYFGMADCRLTEKIVRDSTGTRVDYRLENLSLISNVTTRISIDTSYFRMDKISDYGYLFVQKFAPKE